MGGEGGRWWQRLDGQPGWWPQSSMRATRRRAWLVGHPLQAWLATAAVMYLGQAVIGLLLGMPGAYYLVAVVGAAFVATVAVACLRWTGRRPVGGGSSPFR